MLEKGGDEKDVEEGLEDREIEIETTSIVLSQKLIIYIYIVKQRKSGCVK